MRLGFLAFRNMVSKPLNLLLSLLLLVLSVFLVTFVLQLSKQLSGQLDKNIAPFDMVVGAKGSPLQLVLSSVLHIDVPTGNIKLEEAEFLTKNPMVELAIPVSYGDNYKGYRILGTTHEYLDKYEATLLEGELYSESFEVVVGSIIAQKLQLKVGDTFTSSHGLASIGVESHEDHPYVVKGLLKPTGTVVDRLLISNLESVWEAHEHGEEHGEEHEEEHEHDIEDEHDHEGDDDHDEAHDHNGHDDHDHEDEHAGEEHDHEDREVTSFLVKFKNPLAMVQLPRFINENTNMQAALPGFEVQRLLGLLGSGIKTINGIALAILLVSGLSIFISLLKTIRERRQELALLRIYGLGTAQLLWVVFLEGLLLTLSGFFLGWLLGRIGIWITSLVTEASYGYNLQMTGFDATEIAFLGVALLITLVATLLASISIFKLNISKTLSDA
ncbi:ABC transporter permease [Flagellimonas algicola]|uniref:FtsX-like permease family protein n=1 Tax=Flagellimonas algicola TaxID=2583815 RepID=A0ABY2WIL6_9FLAO|nr:FtsX-like permease family protein [Allomuricauda algicola]TMU54687.1 FtsX-like permease family protein [Allomuricauda algicola]